MLIGVITTVSSERRYSADSGLGQPGLYDPVNIHDLGTGEVLSSVVSVLYIHFYFANKRWYCADSGLGQPVSYDPVNIHNLGTGEVLSPVVSVLYILHGHPRFVSVDDPVVVPIVAGL